MFVNGGYLEFVNVEFEWLFEVEKVIELLNNMLGIKVLWDNVNNNYLMFCFVKDKDEVFVGCICWDEFVVNGFNFWIVADNLCKGVVINVV